MQAGDEPRPLCMPGKHSTHRAQPPTCLWMQSSSNAFYTEVLMPNWKSGIIVRQACLICFSIHHIRIMGISSTKMAARQQQMQTASFIYLYLCVSIAYHVLWQSEDNLRLILPELSGKFTKSHYRPFLKRCWSFGWLLRAQRSCVCMHRSSETRNVKHIEMPFPKAGGGFC